MRAVSFTIPGKPIPQPRPRAARRGPGVHIYTPNVKGLKAYKESITAEASQHDKLEGPLRVKLYFAMPRPASHFSKSKTKIGFILQRCIGIQHTKKPDIDNLIKTVLDAMNGIAYDDDSQIVSISAIKEYAPKGGECVEVCLSEA